MLEALWAEGREVSGRELHAGFPELAYTTLMTTLDRLHRKGLLERRRGGRAYVYSPHFSRAELEQHRAVDALSALFDSSGDDATLRPVLSFLVERVEARDSMLLDELERLVRERRRGRR